MSVVQLPKLEERCWFCLRRKATKLCDFVIGEIWNSRDFRKERATCDRAVCDQCAVQLGDEFDFCPVHAKATKQRLGVVVDESI